MAVGITSELCAKFRASKKKACHPRRCLYAPIILSEQGILSLFWPLYMPDATV